MNAEQCTAHFLSASPEGSGFACSRMTTCSAGFLLAASTHQSITALHCKSSVRTSAQKSDLHRRPRSRHHLSSCLHRPICFGHCISHLDFNNLFGSSRGEALSRGLLRSGELDLLLLFDFERRRRLRWAGRRSQSARRSRFGLVGCAHSHAGRCGSVGGSRRRTRCTSSCSRQQCEHGAQTRTSSRFCAAAGAGEGEAKIESRSRMLAGCGVPCGCGCDCGWACACVGCCCACGTCPAPPPDAPAKLKACLSAALGVDGEEWVPSLALALPGSSRLRLLPDRDGVLGCFVETNS